MIWLLIAHYIADWGLQNDFVAKNKGNYWIIMFSHCFIWAGCVSIALQYLGIFTLTKFIFLFIGHWIMDKIKMVFIYAPCSKSKEDEKYNLSLLYVDQLWHFIQCVIVYII